METNMTPADIRAVVGDEKGDNWFWIIVLFFLVFGFGGIGGGSLTRAELQDGFNYTQLENSVRGVQNGLCDGFYAQNTTMLNGFSGIQQSLSSGIASVNAGISNLASQNQVNTCAITTAIHNEGEATRSLMKQQEVDYLRDQLDQARVVISNEVQTQNILGKLGTYYTNPPFTGGCGCSYA